MSRATGECHNCDLNGQRSPECVKCGGPAELGSHHGKTHYSLEAMQDGGRVVRADECAPTARDQSAFGAAMRMFLELDPTDIHIVSRRYLAEAYGEEDRHSYVMISRHLRCSKQAVEQRFSSVLASNHALASMFPRKRAGRMA
jgi:hypothetical protein